jgi:hypothetical protein
MVSLRGVVTFAGRELREGLVKLDAPVAALDPPHDQVLATHRVSTPLVLRASPHEHGEAPGRALARRWSQDAYVSQVPLLTRFNAGNRLTIAGAPPPVTGETPRSGEDAD